MGMLVRRAARTAVVVGTATAVSGNVSRRQAARNAPAPQEAAPAPQQAPPPAVEAPAPTGVMSEDSMARLTQLGQLHDQGILSDEEFAKAKAEVLGF